MKTEKAPPNGGRVAAAFLVAPIFASILMGLAFLVVGYLEGSPAASVHSAALLIGMFSLPLALLTTLLFGVPAYVLLKPRVERRLVGAILTGAVTAPIGWTGLEIAMALEKRSVDSLPTNLWFIGLLAAVGAAAGIVFWWVAVGPWGYLDRAGD